MAARRRVSAGKPWRAGASVTHFGRDGMELSTNTEDKPHWVVR